MRLFLDGFKNLLKESGLSGKLNLLLLKMPDRISSLIKSLLEASRVSRPELGLYPFSDWHLVRLWLLL